MPVSSMSLRSRSVSDRIIVTACAGVLATGLAYPVVPRGDEEIPFQVNADHTEEDIDQFLEVLSRFAVTAGHG